MRIGPQERNSSFYNDNESYRRGIIFGLTMAEILLLLLFCLLLLLAGVWEKNQNLEGIIDNLYPPNGPPVTDINEVLDDYQKVKRELDQEKVKNKDLNNKISELNDTIKKLKKLLENCEKGPTTAVNENYVQVPTNEWTDTTTKAQIYDKNGWIIDFINNLPSDLRDLALNEDKLKHCKKLINNQSEIATAKSGNDWPPIITLSEAEKFSFESGTAIPNQFFIDEIRGSIKDKIIKTSQKYETDIIEVIGHTDYERVGSSHKTNLDNQAHLSYFGKNNKPLDAVDNAGLGFARAVEVAKLLRSIPELSQYTILPYSGGQLINTYDRIIEEKEIIKDPKRRRIEIRVRRSK